MRKPANNRVFDYFKTLKSKAGRQRSRRQKKAALEFEAMETRQMLSSIVWTNRGSATSDSDQFNAAFGASAAAARAVIDSVLDHWENIIPSFNTGPSGDVPADTIHVQFVMEELPSGTNAAAVLSTVDATGRPRKGSIKLDFNGSPNAAAFGWFVDATPGDHAEFLRNEALVNGPAYSSWFGTAQDGSPAKDKLDLYTIASHELYHLLGLNSRSNLQLHTTPGLVADTGVSAGTGTLWTFNGPSTQFLLTNANGFGVEPRPAHMADSLKSIPANAQFPNGLSGGGGLGSNGAGGRGIRILPSLVDSLFLRDAYGYTTVDPEQFGTFYSVLNTTTGELTVRGQAGNLFPDQISISLESGQLKTSVDNTADRFPNGTAPDAFVTRYTLASVSRVSVIGTDADGISVGRVNGKPITVTGAPGNFNALTIIGNGGEETFTINGNTVRAFNTSLPALATQVAFSGIESMAVRGEGGIDRIHLESADVGSLILRGGAGRDFFEISSQLQNLGSALSPTVFAHGEDDGGELILHDANEAVARTYEIAKAGTLDRIRRDGSQVVDFGTMSHVALQGSRAGSIFNVVSKQSPSSLVVNGNDGNDQFNVGDNNNMAGIAGPLLLFGRNGTNTVRLNDQNASTSNTYKLRTGVVERSNGSNIQITGANLILQAPNTLNIIEIEGLDPAARTEVIGNGGNDTFLVSPGARLFSALASQDLIIRGGAGLDSLTVHDENRIGGNTYFGFGDRIIAGPQGTTSAIVRWDTIENVVMNAGAGGDTFDIEGGGGINPTVVNAGTGNDVFNLARGTGNFGLVTRKFQLNGDGGIDSLTVHDTARTVSSGVVIGRVSISRPGSSQDPVNFAGVESIRFDAGSGDDTIDASTAIVPVQLNGNAGIDILTGGSQGDTLNGAAGSDTLTGNGGNDLLVAGPGADRLFGNDGDDTALQVDAFDTVDLGEGEDGIVVSGTPGNDTILIDWRAGSAGAQAVVTINGNTSIHDYLNGETVTVFAGEGDDVVRLGPEAASRWKAIFHGQGGNDRLEGGRFGDLLFGNDGDDLLFGFGGNDRLSGEAGNDAIYGGNGNDFMSGGSGNDTLRGGKGNDELSGGQGHDYLAGGSGNDLLRGGAGKDTFVGGPGIDSIFARDNAIDLIYANANDLLVEFDEIDEFFGGGNGG